MYSFILYNVISLIFLSQNFWDSDSGKLQPLRYHYGALTLKQQ